MSLSFYHNFKNTQTTYILISALTFYEGLNLLLNSSFISAFSDMTFTEHNNNNGMRL